MKTYTLNLTRNEITRIRMALIAETQEFAHEANDSRTTEARRQIARDSEEMWRRLYNNVKRQQNEQEEAEK